jgi:hypothetical protein
MEIRKIVKLIRPVIFASLLFTMISCAFNPNNQTGAISKEKWCDRDDDKLWSGCWSEIKQIECETGDEFEPEETIGELRLKSDGGYSITWHPFESYTDYAGSYVVNEAQGTITFDHMDAPGFDGNGFYLIRESGDLELTDIWFGSFYKDSDTELEDISCGYVFYKK